MSDSSLNRRRFLSATAGTTTGLALSSQAVVAQPSFDGWFENVDNYDGVTDERGSSEVTVEVGVPNGGIPFGFGPPAVQVDPGTTVTWEWTGNGGSHNVVDLDGNFESDLTSEAGHTFTHTFETEGVSKYYCDPHRQSGMKGAVIVGDLPSTGSGETTLLDYATLAAGALLGVGLVLLPIAAARRSNND